MYQFFIYASIKTMLCMLTKNLQAIFSKSLQPSNLLCISCLFLNFSKMAWIKMFMIFIPDSVS